MSKYSAIPPVERLPEWLRRPIGNASDLERVQGLVKQNRLHTICEEGRCPNRGECYASGTATFLLGGSICTRSCAFCQVEKGQAPMSVDASEASRVADAVEAMGLRYVVLTAVARDDLDDHGAGLFTATMAAIRQRNPLVAIDLSDDKLALARSLGATHTVNAGDADALEQVRAITNGGARTVVESVGSAKVLETAYAATGRAGTTVTVGLPHPDARLDIQAVSLTVDERVLRGSYMGSAIPSRDIPRFIAMYQAGLLPVDKLLSHTLKLEEINEAFDVLDRGEAVRQVIVFD